MCRRVMAEIGKPQAHRQLPSVSSAWQLEKGRLVLNGPVLPSAEPQPSSVPGSPRRAVMWISCPELRQCPVSSSLVTATVAKGSVVLHARMGCMCECGGVMCRRAGNVVKQQHKWPERSGFWFGDFFFV